MTITKSGLYHLLKPIGVMPMGIFVIFISKGSGFKTKGAMPHNHNYYSDEPVELIKELKNENN